MATVNPKFVSYLRVSTDRQGVSGLGLEAQRKAVLDYLNGGRWTLVAEFVETESGARLIGRSSLKRWHWRALTERSSLSPSWIGCRVTLTSCSDCRMPEFSSLQPTCRKRTR